MLKAIVDSVPTSSAKTVNVNPTTTAVVKVIAQIIGNTNLGEKGENVTAQIANRNISNDISSITSHTSFTIIVSAIVQEIETKYDPNSTTTAIGSVSTTGVTEAIIIAIFITTSPPSAPTGVLAAAGSGQVTITWTSVSDAASYNIYYSTTSGVTKLTGTKLTNVTSPYTNTGLTNGTTYYYVITAVNNYGESSESSQVSGHHQQLPQAQPPIPPLPPYHSQVLLTMQQVRQSTAPLPPHSPKQCRLHLLQPLPLQSAVLQAQFHTLAQRQHSHPLPISLTTQHIQRQLQQVSKIQQAMQWQVITHGYSPQAQPPTPQRLQFH